MASTANSELTPEQSITSKRASLMDLRNTDLVSRLLAATPPYLYNIPMIPNSFFFSEMLRSFVQAKANSTEPQRTVTGNHYTHRRTRKRAWTNPREEQSAPPEPKWPGFRPLGDKAMSYYDDSGQKTVENVKEKPLELTTSTVAAATSNYNAGSSSSTDPTVVGAPNQHFWPGYPMYTPSTSLAPYAIDPLHFFIDLRVSGHIYDRKNQAKDVDGTLKSPGRHRSAFSVPKGNKPMNLSGSNQEQHQTPTKFDVKSMGFEKNVNTLGCNYVMSNVERIYREIRLANECYKPEPVDDPAGCKLSPLDLAMDQKDSESPGSPNVEVVALQDDIQLQN